MSYVCRWSYGRDHVYCYISEEFAIGPPPDTERCPEDIDKAYVWDTREAAVKWLREEAWEKRRYRDDLEIVSLEQARIDDMIAQL